MMRLVKSQVVTIVITIHAEGDVDVFTKSHDGPIAVETFHSIPQYTNLMVVLEEKSRDFFVW